jgi:hypothetical protein
MNCNEGSGVQIISTRRESDAQNIVYIHGDRTKISARLFCYFVSMDEASIFVVDIGSLIRWSIHSMPEDRSLLGVSVNA